MGLQLNIQYSRFRPIGYGLCWRKFTLKVPLSSVVSTREVVGHLVNHVGIMRKMLLEPIAVPTMVHKRLHSN